MLQFRGHKALSHFRLQKLSDLIKSIVPQISVIDAEYWYFCKIKRDLKQNELNILQKLLGIDPAQQPPVPEGEFVLVLPRPGTISPWSSKATDIVHHCGIEVIERIERGVAFYIQHEMAFSKENRRAIEAIIHDRMTEAVFHSLSEAVVLFHDVEPVPLKEINILEEDRTALVKANQTMGLALSPDEIDYLMDYFLNVRRNPTDVELMMFAQANSEHCRHKIFNADWIIDGEQKEQSLFSMIRHTHQQHPQGTILAYADNAAIIEGATIHRFCPGKNHAYGYALEPTHLLIKVETHNHPTAICPFPGAATGVGGEIRDEGATGRGAKPKAGLTGFSVSNLRIPNFIQPWETLHGQSGYGKPVRIVSALEIMLTGPIGGAAFNNEFGRPNLAGYFRTFEAQVAGEMRGYHKPIMLAGGIGQISERHTAKQDFSKDALLIQLGGPGMLIGLGGGAASSMDTGTNTEDLDFDSVQRGNAEMQRRAQEVIDRCWQLERSGQPNPILSIHDVGAGGLSNALPELVHGAGCGGHFNLRAIPLEESGMSPMQIWCNEAQERYVLAIRRGSLTLFQGICERERCPYAVVGEAVIREQLIVNDEKSSTLPINMPLSVLLGKPPKMTRVVSHISHVLPPFDLTGIHLQEAAYRVLRLPAVADKTFLITIGDRSVGGMTARDQMVGPWQIPVADVAVTAMGYQTYLGEAFALGERAPLALIDPAASARMAVGEAITNMAAAAINDLSEIKLSANWMAAAGHTGEDAALYDAVHAVAMELCPQLGISIPVGKDSMSMKTAWQELNGNKGSKQKEVIAPLSLIISAFARVRDVRKTLTPQLRTDCGKTELILIDLGSRRNRLGGSALTQVYGQLGNVVPDISTVAEIEKLKRLFSIIQELICADQILAYHDRSDGGLFVTLCEMAFAGHVGMTISLDQLCCDSLAKDAGDEIKPEMLPGRSLERAMAALFNEELGGVIQIKKQYVETVLQMLSEAGLSNESFVLGSPNEQDEIHFLLNNKIIFQEKRINLQRAWSETTYQMQKLRDNPVCAQQEFDRILDISDPGLSAELTFDIEEDIAAPFIQAGIRPKMAILREQGVNGHVEMAAAFDRAGFEAVDVHMSDIITGRVSLGDYKGFVACGGFSYGDVLGAGEGWAKSILFNVRARNEFESFFERSDTFALGVCNGCQMMSNLHEIIPGTDHWPHFERNLSEQFEARFVMVEIPKNPSLFFDGMVGSRLPIQVAHGEGYAAFNNGQQLESASSYVPLRFVDHYGTATERYPFNPNGSPQGIAGMTSTDGRFTILMPHPERVFRTVQHSWHVDAWPEDSPWMRMFRNARKWVE
ncbi:phosphoribosylformylglycinamidine synthase [Nitrosomonas communis]|uniref:Phosphoribosylformylglycinamidine synthase n=1 Tax=Nitrosomonas communis TaxID=44574 RepID=A0A1I4N5V8_9PROT|nr:phosphoribosylformylglycinamidine synthase [Nitrosomonas communis]SFM10964.1 phosphoribosylformylglycinamidine synthase [Nitrosomonas communis]